MVYEVATIAGGCFWCVEAVFEQLAGVRSVESGYTGGRTVNPTYKQICAGDTGHAEALRVTYDPEIVRYGELLDVFFATHDPTTLNRQGGDRGTQYRSAIFPHDAEQRAEADAAIRRAAGDWPDPIVTTVETLAEWYPAEREHQNYYERVGNSNPYCSAVIAPKVAKFRKQFADRLRAKAA